MYKFFVSCALICLLSLPAHAQAPVVAKSSPYQPLGYCQITSLGSAVALVSASCSTGAVPTGATIAEICVEAEPVRYRDDGIAPTISLGMEIGPASSTQPTCFPYAITPFSAVQFIAVTNGAIIDVSFYK